MNSAISACKLTALAFIFLAVLASQTGKEKKGLPALVVDGVFLACR
jgi:hypothetical protein